MAYNVGRAPSRAIYGDINKTSDQELSDKALKALEENNTERAKFLSDLILSNNIRNITYAYISDHIDKNLKIQAFQSFKEPEKAIEIAKGILSKEIRYETIARIVELTIVEDIDKADKIVRSFDSDLMKYVQIYTGDSHALQ